jgi:hypothetical protein
MILNTREAAPTDISGVILIDCWESNSGQSPAMVESLNKFYTSLYDNLCLLKPQIVIDATVYYEGSTLSQKLVPWVKTYPNVKCTTVNEFETLWRRQRKTRQSKLKNWLVVGLEWQMCAHCNNLGLLNLALMTHCVGNKINFFSADWGFWKWDSQQQWLTGNCKITAQHYIDDFLSWQICKKEYYRLLGMDELTWRQVSQQYIDINPDIQ